MDNEAPASLLIRSVDFAPGRIELAMGVPVDGRGFLVVSQADYPGWQALVNLAGSLRRRPPE
jgi:hypothetical protein